MGKPLFIERAMELPKSGDYAALRLGNTVYFATAGDETTGNIDPLYVILALALDKGKSPGAVWTTYEVGMRWLVAAKGLEHLGNTVMKEGGGFKFAHERLAAGKQPPAAPQSIRVDLDGGRPAEGKVISEGSIFTPNAHGFHNIPRLYLLAALAIEAKSDASVAALVVNAEGLIVAQATKAHKEYGCGHAEVRALFSIKGRVPKRWAIFSTLRPCTMCAGLIHALKQPGDKQYWAREDPSIGASPAAYSKLGIDSSDGHPATVGQREANKIRNIKTGDKAMASFTEDFGAAWRTGQEKMRKGKEDGSGIIEFIGSDKSSTNLRDVARQSLASKFVKYGKAATDARGAVGVAPGNPTRNKPRDPRMQEIADYLYVVVGSAKTA